MSNFSNGVPASNQWVNQQTPVLVVYEMVCVYVCISQTCV